MRKKILLVLCLTFVLSCDKKEEDDDTCSEGQMYLDDEDNSYEYCKDGELTAIDLTTGFSEYEVVEEDYDAPSVGYYEFEVGCPKGKSVLGGGCKVHSNHSCDLSSFPISERVWAFRGQMQTGFAYRGYVVCAVVD